MRITNMLSPTKPQVGVLGGAGMLGSDLVRYLGETQTVFAIDRHNYADFRGRHFDVIVNANGNSKRFWADQNPAQDFEFSTASVVQSCFDFKFGTYIYISSPDVYADPGSPSATREQESVDPQQLSPYGFHKRLAEEVERHYAADFVILRSAALLGAKLAKGIVYDILQGNALYVNLDTRIQFLSTQAVAEIIQSLLARKTSREIFNMGGIGTVTPSEIAAWAGKPIQVRADAAAPRHEMNFDKIKRVYALKTSAEYVQEFMA